MFVTHPRPKKGVLVAPPRKKRKAFTVEEINFDTKDRAEYLTGFHKRKVERRLKAKEKAEEKAREERLALRKEVIYVPCVYLQSAVNLTAAGKGRATSSSRVAC